MAEAFTESEIRQIKKRTNLTEFERYLLATITADRKQIEELEKDRGCYNCGSQIHDGEKNACESCSNAIRRHSADQTAEIERLRGALEKIAVFGDETANAYFEKNGSYGAFDEPGSVEIARQTLKGSE